MGSWVREPASAAEADRAGPPGRRLRTALQIGLTVILGWLIPYFIYRAADAWGLDISPAGYLVIVLALAVTAVIIWTEGLLAQRRIDPPEPGAAFPPATAIIAAYLPNEAATVLESIEAFLEQDYPAPLQIILAYNTPQTLPVEAALHELARREPRFTPLRVEGSSSKAQNINAALPEARGEFVGIFDADHHPAPGSFRRAWGWLSNGYDVVQGRCRIRNGTASFVARLVTVEFELIYGITHPGRARLHTFGIFGGSNGYWKTDLLRRIRMRSSMLTEDIDSSIRAVADGHRIQSDPWLVSSELAPATWRALWNQRNRWAQGWYQVSLSYLGGLLGSPRLTLRQKAGLFWLLGWREVYPWISVQMFPLIAFWALKYGGLDRLDWLVPVFVLTTVFTLSAGPGLVLLAYRVATPETRQFRRWFIDYLLAGTLFYAEFKNEIGRVAQIKEWMGERVWRVTPRGPADS